MWLDFRDAGTSAEPAWFYAAALLSESVFFRSARNSV